MGVTMRKQFRHLSSLEDALDVLDQLSFSSSTEDVPLANARGRVVAEPIDADLDVPGFDRSIMDGYAVRSAETIGAYDDDPVELTYGGSVTPGTRPSVTVGEGQAVEIATGAVIPDGADAVVKVEDTTRDGESVKIYRPATPQEHIMARGTDIADGSTVLRPGERLDARHIGLLAAIGIDSVPVSTPPTVGIISTGEEIVRPGDAADLDVGEIFDINSFSIAAAIEDVGGRAVIHSHVSDDYDAIREAFEAAAVASDLVVSSGSTSASAEDVVYRVIEEAGELLLHGITVKPGKPTVFGRIADTPVLGMPGNPISALMNFRLFVRPLLQGALGVRSTRIGSVEATVAVDMDSVGGRTQLAPVGLVEDPRRGVLAYPVDKGSGAITSLADADGYLTIDDNIHYVAGGEQAAVTLLDDAVSHPDVLLCGDSDPVIETTIDMVAAEVRYLDAGGIDGLRKLRDGIPDIAAVSVPEPVVESFEIEFDERYTIYDRSIGLLYDDARTRDEILDGGTIATLSRQSGLASHLETLTEANGWDVTVVDRPSTGGLVRAVATGAVDSAFLDAASVRGEENLTFDHVAWAPCSLIIGRGRAEKPGVTAFLDAIQAILDDDPSGVRHPSSVA